jgi:hypothetical protein
MEGDRQAKFPYDRKERFAALQAIDRTKLPKPVGRIMWAHVVELLTQIDLCTGRDGCFAYTETLAARFYNNVGVSRAAFFRIKGLACELDLLTVENRKSPRGQLSNEWRVEWSKIMTLAAREDVRLCAPKVRPTRPQVRLTPSRTETPPSRSETHYKGITSSVALPLTSLRSSDERVSVSREPTQPKARRPSGWVDWDQAAILAREITRKLGPCRTDKDRSLVAKAAALSRRFGEFWLWDSVEAVVRARNRPNPLAYFHRCLADKCEGLGVDFNRELAALVVPPEVLAADPARDLSERSCVAPGGSFER